MHRRHHPDESSARHSQAFDQAISRGNEHVTAAVAPISQNLLRRSSSSVQPDDTSFSKFMPPISDTENGDSSEVVNEVNDDFTSSSPSAYAPEVRIRLVIQQVTNIDMIMQSFTCVVRLEASWTDEGIAKLARAHKLMPKIDAQAKPRSALIGALRKHAVHLEVDEERTSQVKGALIFREDPSRFFFTPRLVFDNLAETHEWEDWYEILADTSNTDKVIVCYRVQAKLTFQQQFDFHKFPLDMQQLKVHLVAHWDKRLVQLVRNQNSQYRSFVNTKLFCFSNEYNLTQELQFEQSETPPEESASRNSYPMLTATLLLSRKSAFWFWNFIVSVFFITGFSFTSFGVALSSIGERLGINVTVLLTLVAFKLVVAEKLPQINYLTFLDVYFLLSVLISVGVAVANVIIFHYNKDEETKTEPYVALGCFAAWTAINALVVAFASLSTRRSYTGSNLWDSREDLVWIGRIREDISAKEIGSFLSSEMHNVKKPAGIKAKRFWPLYVYVFDIGQPSNASSGRNDIFRPVRKEFSGKPRFAIACFNSRHGASEACSLDVLSDAAKALKSTDHDSIRIEPLQNSLQRLLHAPLVQHCKSSWKNPDLGTRMASTQQRNRSRKKTAPASDLQQSSTHAM